MKLTNAMSKYSPLFKQNNLNKNYIKFKMFPYLTQHPKLTK